MYLFIIVYTSRTPRFTPGFWWGPRRSSQFFSKQKYHVGYSSIKHIHLVSNDIQNSNVFSFHQKLFYNGNGDINCKGTKIQFTEATSCFFGDVYVGNKSMKIPKG